MSFWLLAKCEFKIWEFCSRISLVRCNTPCHVDLHARASLLKLSGCTYPVGCHGRAISYFTKWITTHQTTKPDCTGPKTRLLA